MEKVYFFNIMKSTTNKESTTDPSNALNVFLINIPFII